MSGRAREFSWHEGLAILDALFRAFDRGLTGEEKFHGYVPIVTRLRHYGEPFLETLAAVHPAMSVPGVSMRPIYAIALQVLDAAEITDRLPEMLARLDDQVPDIVPFPNLPEVRKLFMAGRIPLDEAASWMEVDKALDGMDERSCNAVVRMLRPPVRIRAKARTVKEDMLRMKRFVLLDGLTMKAAAEAIHGKGAKRAAKLALEFGRKMDLRFVEETWHTPPII